MTRRHLEEISLKDVKEFVIFIDGVTVGVVIAFNIVDLPQFITINSLLKRKWTRRLTFNLSFLPQINWSVLNVGFNPRAPEQPRGKRPSYCSSYRPAGQWQTPSTWHCFSQRFPSLANAKWNNFKPNTDEFC